jgi:hypothetical protein
LRPLLEALAELDGSFARGRFRTDDADLAQHAQQVAASRDTSHFERTRNLALVGHTDVRALVAQAVNDSRPGAGSACAERLYALPFDEPFDCPAIDAQDATHAHRVEAAVVDQAPDRLGMNTEPIGDIANAVERPGVDVRRHTCNLTQPQAPRMGRSAHCR